MKKYQEEVELATAHLDMTEYEVIAIANIIEMLDNKYIGISEESFDDLCVELAYSNYLQQPRN